VKKLITLLNVVDQTLRETGLQTYMSALVSWQEETHGSVAFIENITNQQFQL